MKSEVNFHFVTDDEGGVSWIKFRKVLNSFQSALYALGEYSKYGEIKSSGRRPYSLMKEYTLRILPIKSGSLNATVKLPTIQKDYLTNPYEDLENLVEVLKTIKSKEEIQKILPDTRLRRRVLRHLDGLKKSEDSPDFEIAGVSIDEEFQENITEFMTTTTVEDDLEIMGEILELKITGNNQYFGVLSDKGIIKIPLTGEFKHIVIENVEKVVVVHYTALYDPNSNKEEINKITDIIPIDSDYFEIDKVNYNKTTLWLIDNIRINISLSQEFYVLENEDFDILSYGDNFVTAWKSFQEDFINLYEHLITKDDKNLTEKAKSIKQRFNANVDRKEQSDAKKS